MEPGHVSVRVAHFLSIAIQLAEHGGRLIREIHDSGDIGQEDKDGMGDPVTKADLTVQRTCETVLKHYFPSLSVKGEESAESMAGIEVTLAPESLSIDLITDEYLDAHIKQRAEFNAYAKTLGYEGEIWDTFEEFDTSKAVVWIDPLDGTSDFVAGNLSAVTVLIGLAVDGVPKVGVVHNAFETSDSASPGMTIFGTQEHGAFRLDFDPKADAKALLARMPTYLEPFQAEEFADD